MQKSGCANVTLALFSSLSLCWSISWSVPPHSTEPPYDISKKAATEVFADDFFEGPEKTLMLKFNSSHIVNGSLRTFPEEAWRGVMERMGIAILSKIESAHGKPEQNETEDKGCTAYLLSESSLFVYRDRVVFKTCGLSSPLRGLRLFLDVARNPGSSGEDGLEQVLYSHPAYMRQEEQAAPHQSWADEVAFLRDLFPNGTAERLGTPKHGTDVFVANFVEEQTSPWFAAEVYITDLEQQNAHETFSKNLETGKNAAFWNAMRPDATDEFYFDPSGYSANILRGSTYSTMHASPQSSGSYLSHATNAMKSPQELKDMVDQTLRLAPGSHVGVFLFAFAPNRLQEPLTNYSSYAFDGYFQSEAWTAQHSTFHASLLSLTALSAQSCSNTDYIGGIACSAAQEQWHLEATA